MQRRSEISAKDFLSASTAARFFDAELEYIKIARGNTTSHMPKERLRPLPSDTLGVNISQGLGRWYNRV
eukprot:COSAG06_NODE_1936_length_8030_cov_4.318245_1_plen_68_part_10